MKRSRLLVFVIVLTMITTLFATPVSAVLDTSDTLTAHEAEFLALLNYDHADYLAHYLSEEIGNRITFSPRRDMATEWLLDEFESYGYEPYTQDFVYTTTPTVNGLIWIDGDHYAYYGPTWNASTVYQYDDSDEVAINGAVVVDWPNSGQAFVAPDADYTGKAVFVTLNGSAPNAANFYNAALTLQDAGAAAVMFQTVPMAENGNTTYSRIGNATEGDAINIPVGTTLNYETSGILSSLDDNSVVKLNLYANNVGKNVIAVLPSATGNEKTVYITSHYDSMQSGPGMNDNGSGTIMTLEMARAFKEWKFDYNLVFIIFDAEESGLRGAYAYCEQMSQEERAGFVANYNMDMIATSQENCEWMFMNISDARLRIIDRSYTDTNVALADYPEAVAIAEEYGIYNTTMLAAKKLGRADNLLFCYDTTTDHYAFVRYGNGDYDNHVNMMNAVEYDWRSNRKGTAFEMLYHKAGDTYELNFSIDKCKYQSDIIALAIYHAARGDIELEGVVAKASVLKQNGNKNLLTVTVTETWTNYEDITYEIIYAETISINNNAAGIYSVDDYAVYVDTKGNDQIRACYLVN